MSGLLAISSIAFGTPTPTDAAFVGTTRGDRTFSTEPGVPLANAAAPDVNRRKQVQESLGRAFRAAASERNAAGAYLDNGDAPVFLTSGDPASLKRGVGRHIPANVEPRFQRVRYSTKELKVLQERINADLDAGKLQDQEITSTAIDTRANAVVVGTSRVTNELQRTLVRKYGEGLVVAFESSSEGGDAGCASRTDCPPAKAGLRINATYNSRFCTTGPIVRVASSSALRILTAGHCLGLAGGTGTSKRWTHNGATLGWSEVYAWGNGSNADVGLINPNTNPIIGDRNLLYRSSNADIVGLTAWKPTAEQVQGSLVCRAAAVSGYHCGSIVLTDKTKDVDGRLIDHQWVVDFDACPGDSGAPYLLGTVAWGIHTDSTAGCDPSTGQAWYSPMGWVSSVLSAQGHPVEMCADAGCTSSANTWAPRGSLNGDVWSPRVVKLLDGRVLQVGGEPIAQIFDPATGTWSDTAPPPWLPKRCAEQFAVRLADGRVLVGGGASPAGGEADPCAATAYMFDPSTGSGGSWTTAASMPQTIRSAGAVLLGNGRAFVTGGTGADGKTSIALAYAPATNAWTTLTPAPAGAIGPLVLRLNDGRVLVSGGYTITDPSGPRYADSASTYLYNPASNTWSSTTNVGARGVGGLVLSDGRVAVAGGQRLTWNQGQGYAFSTTVSVLNPATGAWTQLAPLRTGRADFTLVQLATGQLLAAAGNVASTAEPSGVPSRTADVYDWATNAWYPAASLQEARAEQGSVVLDDGTVLAVGGGTDSSEAYTPGDVTPPSIATPLTSTALGSTIGDSTVPVRIGWTATDAGGSGLGLYDVARSYDGGAFTTVATSLTSASYATTLAVGHTYRFQVRGRDNAGNLGPWKAGAAILPGTAQQTAGSVKYTGTWSTGSTPKYLGGTVKFASTAGASATYTFTGRSIAWVTTRAARSGSARIYLDGVLLSTVSLYASAYTYRYVAFENTWATSGFHTIKVVVVGTSGHPRIDIDAFVILRNP